MAKVRPRSTEKAAALVAAGLFLGAGRARAQDTEPPAGQAAPLEGALDDQETSRHLSRPANVPAGVVQVFLPVQISVSKGTVAQPVFAAPNVSYGVTERLTVRLLHGEGYRAPDAIAGVCFTGRDGGCPRVYDNVSADAVYLLVDGDSFSLTASGGLSVAQLDPLSFGVMVGSAMEWSLSDKFALQFEPAVLVALNETDAGNPHRFGATARALAQVSKEVLLFGLVGLFSPFDDFSHSHQGPVGAGGFRSLGPNMDLGLQFTFTNLYGADATLHDRQVTVLTAFRL